MTMRYSHLSQEHVREAINRIGFTKDGTNMAQATIPPKNHSRKSLQSNKRV